MSFGYSDSRNSSTSVHAEVGNCPASIISCFPGGRTLTDVALSAEWLAFSLFYQVVPFVRFETDQNLIFTDQQRALDQFAVRSQQSDLFRFAHRRQLVLQFHLLINQSAGVEKVFQRKLAAFDSFCQFFDRRIPIDDMAVLVRYFMLIQPFFCISAGVAFRVF